MAGGASSDEELISQINVTPLVDIILVLLIIFMVTAKMIVSQGMPMDLPKSASGEDIQTVFSVDLGANGQTMVDSKKVGSDEAISPLAKDAKKKNKDIRAVIRADKKVEHGRVIKVLDLLKKAGIAKVAFAVTKSGGAPSPEPEEEPAEEAN